MAAPVAPPVRVRWGIPDVVLAWLAGLIGAVVVTAVAVAVLGVPENDISDDIGVLLAGLLGQNAAVIGVLALIATTKGARVVGAAWWATLRRNFGLEVHVGDAGWLAAGVGLQIALSLALAPIAHVYGRNEPQSVVDSLDDASGIGLALFVVAVVAVAPVAEELLFRGALLRALLRRTTPAWAVFASAFAFAAVHPLGDPSVGSLIAVPALLGVGLVSGYLAVRSGTLSRSILLHAGFNLLTIIGILAG